MYPKIIMEHFLSPKNVGKIEHPDSQGEYISPSGGKAIFYLHKKDVFLDDIKYQVSGCPLAIAVCSIISVYGTGKKIEELKKVSKNFLKEYFELKEDQEECVNLALVAFIDAINKL